MHRTSNDGMLATRSLQQDSGIGEVKAPGQRRGISRHEAFIGDYGRQGRGVVA